MRKQDQIKHSTCPAARTEDLSVTTVGDETVVYDQLTHNASCLNAVTTAVWNACNGENDGIKLLEALRRAGFQDANEETVWLAIEQLGEAELLVASTDVDVQVNIGLNRREMLRTLGKGAVMAVPVVSTIAVQPAAMAGSECAANGNSCASLPCCTGTCNGSFICV